MSVPIVAEALNACKPVTDDGWLPTALTKTQNELVLEICELIIPVTETPGASDVGVNRFIDLLLKDVLPDEDRTEFLNGMEVFERHCEAENGEPFLELSLEKKKAWVEKLDSRNDVDSDKGRAFILTLKDLTLVTYFSSEAGVKQNFNYVPIPGIYDGCRSMVGDEKTTVGDHI